MINKQTKYINNIKQQMIKYLNSKNTSIKTYHIKSIVLANALKAHALYLNLKCRIDRTGNKAKYLENMDIFHPTCDLYHARSECPSARDTIITNSKTMNMFAISIWK